LTAGGLFVEKMKIVETFVERKGLLVVFLKSLFLELLQAYSGDDGQLLH